MLTVLQRLLGGDAPPNKVQEIKSDSLQILQVLHRDDSMVLYAPPPGQAEKKAVYEIVLNRPFHEGMNTSFSLYRAATLEDAEEKFNAFVHRLPVFVQIVKEMYNINGLQKICDTLIENPSWSLAHLVAYFNLTEYVLQEKIFEFIDYPDHKSYMSPLQLAVMSANSEMVKTLLPLCKIDHLDNNSSSVYHYAASTTKDIINILAAKGTVNMNHCNSDGYTPLHLACLADKPECVKALLLAGADVNISARNISAIYNKKTENASSVAEFLQTNPNKLVTQDMKHGGTPLHWSSSREVIEALIERGTDVNALNFDGRTALHIMVARNRLDCCVALLAHEADIDLRDKDGNTPLHVAVEKKLVPIVQCLVVFGCDINMKNKEGKTPRHMVGKDASGSNDDMILYILHSVGAKRCPPNSTKCPAGCNATGTYNGIPPATPESPESREHIQQMLASTVRGSRPSLSKCRDLLEKQNQIVDTTPVQRGQSVMDALLGMFTNKVARAEPALASPDAPLVDVDMPSSSSPPAEPEKTPEEEAEKRGRLLCLDGGGIRGLVLVQMLLEMEKLSQTPISHMFDWMAGTSTGGILALGLATGKTMRQCMCLYLRMKDQAFVGSRPYPSEFLEAVLKDNLGEFTVMSDIVAPKIMVTGVMADRKPVDLHLFRNYKSASDILGIVTPTNNRRIPPPIPEEQLVWRAARATGAAPSYFRAFGRFLDGGLIANNPTLDAMTEIHEYNMALRRVGREKEVAPVSVVVSLGTGMIPVTELKEIDVFRPDSIWDTAKLAYGISAIGNLLVDQATAADGRVVDRARAWCSMIEVPYFRFNPQLSEDVPMDEKSDQKLINMMWEAKAYIYANRNKVIEMINLLK
ncbi:85/88 kDa calcium-independent phospholipase A2 isoform X2 [Phlebotomus argentipes]|uniref:85/88 kDa calcium-independent phospholipase A2 isoform X2 n=1 Tax=Phlebotomus argentipes TaxID=94469 RepID=UPI002892A8F4|nr:85/88 kDa calcium-independent phospholipase A2 isoform X2 [Phlebotomus argentipes]